MMQEIKRAETGHIQYQEKHRQDCKQLLDKLDNRGYDIFETRFDKFSLGGYVQNVLRRYNAYTIGEDQDEDLQIEMLFTYRRLAKSFYKVIYSPEGTEVEVEFREGKVVKHTAQVLKNGLDFYTWLNAWNVFHMLRDCEGIALLREQTEAAREASSIPWGILEQNVYKLFTYFYTPEADIEVLKGLFEEVYASLSKDSGHYLQEAFAVEWVLRLYAPMIELWQYAVSGNQEMFDDTLLYALEQHKEYWGTEKDNRNNSSKGWVSWYLMGPVCYAYDRGLKVNVKSDYITDWLIKGGATS